MFSKILYCSFIFLWVTFLTLIYGDAWLNNQLDTKSLTISRVVDHDRRHVMGIIFALLLGGVFIIQQYKVGLPHRVERTILSCIVAFSFLISLSFRLSKFLVVHKICLATFFASLMALLIYNVVACDELFQVPFAERTQIHILITMCALFTITFFLGSYFVFTKNIYGFALVEFFCIFIGTIIFGFSFPPMRTSRIKK